MYKVFVDNISICFQKDLTFSSNLPKEYSFSVSKENFAQFKTDLQQVSKTQEFIIKSTDPLKTIKTFFKSFKWIEAAGGIVENTNSQRYLFILRNGLWDIPKGKIEKKESPTNAAIREVQEECGINEINIVGELSPTYHVYFAYGKYFIKKTYWYKMETKETDVIPQIEEGITEVRWFKQNEFDTIKENTFASILDVIDDYGTEVN